MSGSAFKYIITEAAPGPSLPVLAGSTCGGFSTPNEGRGWRMVWPLFLQVGLVRLPIFTLLVTTAAAAQTSPDVSAPPTGNQPNETQGAAARPAVAQPIALKKGQQTQASPMTSAQLLVNDAAIPPDQVLTESEAGPDIGRAGDDIDLALGQRHIYSDLRTLADRITDMRRATLNVVVQRSTQSDSLDILHEEASLDVFFDEGRSRIRPGLQFIKYTSKSLPVPFLQYAEGFTGNVRVSDDTAIAGEFWLNQLKPKGGSSNTLVTYNVFGTYFPSDYVRVDVDTDRQVFDNVRSLQLGLTVRHVGGSIDYTPTNSLRFSLRGNAGFYSDHNERQFGEAEAIWRIESKPVIELGVRATAFHFDKLLLNGYFNPKHYKSGEAMLRLQYDFSERLNVQAAGSGGIEDAYPGGSKPIVKASLEFSYRIYDGWTIDGGANYFSSRTATTSGFSRTNLTLGLHHKFK